MTVPTFTVAELSRRTKDALRQAQDSAVTITSNGRATGLLLGIAGLDPIAAQRLAIRIQAEQAVAALQAASSERGLDQMGEERINEVIADVRRERHARSD
ncbi:MAG: hypothetical protein LBG11_07070 [Bifidobacteriaceae bacterium]|jgi:prevent-host-death family protein|nr:hypothetical protein [Bifidobacteriaceae bacterium]